jgi:hypothetical protein
MLGKILSRFGRMLLEALFKLFATEVGVVVAGLGASG